MTASEKFELPRTPTNWLKLPAWGIDETRSEVLAAPISVIFSYPTAIDWDPPGAMPRINVPVTMMSSSETPAAGAEAAS